MANFLFDDPDAAAAEWCNSIVEQADPFRGDFEPLWAECWDNFTVGLANSRISGRTVDQIRSAESHQITRTLTAYTLSTVFGVRDYIRSEPMGDEDYGAAHKVNAWLMSMLEQPGNYRSMHELTQELMVFGSALYRTFWDSEMGIVPRRVPAYNNLNEPILDPMTGEPVTVMKLVKIPLRDHARVVPMSLLDVWFDMAAGRMSDVKATVYRDRVDEQTFMSQEGPGWRRAAMKQALVEAKDTTYGSFTGREDHMPVLGRHEDRDMRELKQYGYRTQWCIESYLPPELYKTFNLPKGCFTVLRVVNNKCVYAAPSMSPVAQSSVGGMTVLPTSTSIYGLPPLGIVASQQMADDTLLRLFLRAGVESVHGNYVVGTGAAAPVGFAKKLKNRKPRQVFTVGGDPRLIAPLQQDYSGLQLATMVMAQNAERMRNATFTPDPLRGIMGSVTRTATETNVTSSAALQNMAQVSSLLERDELPGLGSRLFWLGYVNLPDEGAVIRRVGDDESHYLRFHEISPGYHVFFVGARQAISRQQQANSLMQAMTILASNPVLAARANWDKLFRMWAEDGAGLAGIGEVLAPLDSPEVAQALVAGALGQGGGAGSVPGLAGPADASGNGVAGASPTTMETGAQLARSRGGVL